MKDSNINALRLQSREKLFTAQQPPKGFWTRAMEHDRQRKSLKLREREMALLERGMAAAALQNVLPQSTQKPDLAIAKLPKTTKKKSRMLMWTLLVIGIAVLGKVTGAPTTGNIPKATQVADIPAPCAFDDVQCAGKKFYFEANDACTAAVEQQASYQMRWTSNWLDRKFPQYTWGGDATHKTITYGGDRAQFQNGFGAWKTVTYFCTYSPEMKSIVDVTIH